MILLTDAERGREWRSWEGSSRTIPVWEKALILAQARKDYKWGDEECWETNHHKALSAKVFYILRKDCPGCRQSIRDELGL